MTEKQMRKFEGKRVCIKMHLFPHSVSTVSLRGIIESEEVPNIYYKDGQMKKKIHYDFWLLPEPNENRKTECIRWNQLKLIIEVNEY